eukprot:293949-Pleurochrysis_carterae.AAC.1
MPADAVGHHVVTAAAARHKEGGGLCRTQWVRAKASLEGSAAWFGRGSVVLGSRRRRGGVDSGAGGRKELVFAHWRNGGVSRRRGSGLRWCSCRQ